MDTSPWAGPAEPAASDVRPRFYGSAGAMAPVVIKGLLLTLVTLGLYRFWYVTNVRRFLWNATEIDGDSVEYLGRGVELFIGFLIALAVVIPLYGLIALASLVAGPVAGGVLQFASTLMLVVLAQYALFRARRYRLTRTVWRGVRLQQTGSGWAYAGRSIGWGIVAVMTLGLAYPAMRASLERYKMENTWYGDQKASFESSGWTLFRRGVVLWLLAVVLLAASGGVIAGIAANRPQGPGAAQADVLVPFAILGAGAIFGLLTAIVMPIYQAIEFRWWAEGCRFGETRVRAELGLFAFFRVYLVFALIMILFFAVLSAIGGALLSTLQPGFAAGGPGVVEVALSVIVYFGTALMIAALWQMFVVRPVWKKSFEGVAIVNLPALAATQSTTPPANAFGEGVADAIDFGGF